MCRFTTRWLLIAATACHPLLSRSVIAQAPGAYAQERAQVLILGTYHMAGGSDYVQSVPDDILAPRRQRDLEDLTRGLALFRPTKIFVESTPDRDSALNQRYQRYVAGRDTLTANEIDQVGFRLAKRVGLARLAGIDFTQDEDIASVMAWAAAHGDTGFVQRVTRFVTRLKVTADSLPQLSVAAYLLRVNDPALDAASQDGYLHMARVGGDTTALGAEVVAGRYHRNMRIFANLAQRIVPGDRVLIIYGWGHGALLREFVRASSDLSLVSPRTYLEAAGKGTLPKPRGIHRQRSR